MDSSQWIQLNIETNPQKTEIIEDAVLAAGAVSVTLQDAADQPILEPGVGETPLWDRCTLTALFPPQSSLQEPNSKFNPIYHSS